MEYKTYYLCFPDGDTQEIDHPLTMGDLIDINGNVFSQEELNPREITYRVSIVKKETKFKETFVYHFVEMLTRDDVIDEIEYTNFEKKKQNIDLNAVFNKLEQKLKKKR
jgi:hypothetical protein